MSVFERALPFFEGCSTVAAAAIAVTVARIKALKLLLLKTPITLSEQTRSYTVFVISFVICNIIVMSHSEVYGTRTVFQTLAQP